MPRYRENRCNQQCHKAGIKTYVLRALQKNGFWGLHYKHLSIQNIQLVLFLPITKSLACNLHGSFRVMCRPSGQWLWIASHWKSTDALVCLWRCVTLCHTISDCTVAHHVTLWHTGNPLMHSTPSLCQWHCVTSAVTNWHRCMMGKPEICGTLSSVSIFCT